MDGSAAPAAIPGAWLIGTADARCGRRRAFPVLSSPRNPLPKSMPLRQFIGQRRGAGARTGAVGMSRPSLTPRRPATPWHGSAGRQLPLVDQRARDAGHLSAAREWSDHRRVRLTCALRGSISSSIRGLGRGAPVRRRRRRRRPAADRRQLLHVRTDRRPIRHRVENRSPLMKSCAAAQWFSPHLDGSKN